MIPSQPACLKTHIWRTLTGISNGTLELSLQNRATRQREAPRAWQEAEQCRRRYENASRRAATASRLEILRQRRPRWSSVDIIVNLMEYSSCGTLRRSGWDFHHGESQVSQGCWRKIYSRVLRGLVKPTENFKNYYHHSIKPCSEIRISPLGT